MKLSVIYEYKYLIKAYIQNCTLKAALTIRYFYGRYSHPVKYLVIKDLIYIERIKQLN